MKKIFDFWVHLHPTLKKIIMELKIAFLLVVVSVSNVFATPVYSQVAKVSLDMENKSLEQVMDKIEGQTEFYFIFNQKQIDVNRVVNIKEDNKLITDVLPDLFKGTNINYVVFDRKILLTTDPFDNNLLAIASGTKPQQKQITGTVTYKDGNPLPGVNVVVTGTTVGVITNIDGKYSINVPEGAMSLTFTFMGMQAQEISIGTLTQIDATMEESAYGLDEVVVVGYGTQKKENVTGAVASVGGDVLAKTSVVSTTNSLVGLLPGIVSKQTGGEPGRDVASISIRGFGSPLIIVDGVARSFNDIDPKEIESVTILKDASAGIYGARAGNGVILVTTKRGSIAKPEISYSSSYTLQSLTFLPKPVNAGQYATLMNEKNLSDGDNAIYTDEQVQKYFDGSDPLNYPNANWWKAVMRDWAPEQQHNISISGGNEVVKYFTYLGYVEQGGMYKSGDLKYKRYNLRSNIDAKITKDLSVSFDLSYIVGNLMGEQRNIGYIFQDFYDCLPIYATSLPDPTKTAWGGSVPNNPINDTHFDLSGYNRIDKGTFNPIVQLNYNFPAIKGLSLKAMGSYLQIQTYNKIWSKQSDVWTYDYASDTYTWRGSTAASSLNESYSTDRSFTTQLSLNYQQTFKEVHNISALALYERIDVSGDSFNAHGENFLTTTLPYLFAAGGQNQTVGGSATQDGRQSYVGRLNYNFKEKYLAQATIRYDGSPKFAKDNRWGFFPSISLGWRISEEGFVKNNLTWINNLKLRTSLSNMGYDAIGNYQFITGYKLNSNYMVDNKPMITITSTGLANPNVTWEKMTTYDAGLEISLFQSLIYGEFDFFFRKREGILATRIQSLPTTFGATLPNENLNSQNNRGFEILLGHRNRINGFNYDISANISFTRAKWVHYDEPVYTDPDDISINQRSGKWTDIVYAYKSDGLFTSQDEINNYPLDQDTKKNSTIRPGDIKYVDMNGDNVLNWRDKVNIGVSSIPEIMFGFNTNMEYKGFSLSFLVQGATNCDVQIGSVLPTGQATPIQIVWNKRWTAENNNPHAIIPRVSEDGRTNNLLNSDYWYVDGTYVRLKLLNLGYSIPSKLTKKIGVNKVRLFLSGTNLFTISKTIDYDLDPEMPDASNGRYYPQQKTMSFGIDIIL